VSGRAAAPAIACAAVALALGLPGILTACGEKEERTTGVSGAEVSALVRAGLAAVGSDAPPSAITFSADGPVLRVRITAPPSGALAGFLASFRGVHAEVERFCPKPALLSCRPSLRAWASPLSRHAVETTVAALRRLAAQTYDEPPLVRRHARVTRIVTANGELLAAVRTAGAAVSLSFGGLAPPRRPADVLPGRLDVEAGAGALVAIRRDLPRTARRALAGVRRLIVTAPLP
jgi:hypothetical protein